MVQVDVHVGLEVVVQQQVVVHGLLILEVEVHGLDVGVELRSDEVGFFVLVVTVDVDFRSCALMMAPMNVSVSTWIPSSSLSSSSDSSVRMPRRVKALFGMYSMSVLFFLTGSSLTDKQPNEIGSLPGRPPASTSASWAP